MNEQTPPSHATAPSRIERTLRLIRDCNRLVIHATDETALLRDVCRLAVEIGGYRFAWVGFAVTDDVKTVSPVAQAGEGGGYLDAVTIRWSDTELGRGPVGSTIRTGRPHWTRNIETDTAMSPWRDQALRHGFRSSISLPIATSEHVLGAFSVYAGVPDAFDEEEVDLLLDLAGDMAYALTALRARAALTDSERRWQFALEGAGDGVWDWNAVTNTVMFSRRWKEMLGYREDEIGPRLEEWSSRVHPDDLAAIMAAVRAHLDGHTPHYESEHRLRCKDGTWKWVLDRGLVMMRTPDGKPVRVVGTHADITGRKEAEKVSAAQLSELLRWQDVMLDREDRVHELKAEVNALCLRAGDPVRYASQDEGTAGAKAPKA